MDPLKVLSTTKNESKPGKGRTKTLLFRIIQALELNAAVSYILDSQRRFIYCNPAWDRFVRSNGEPQLAGEAMIGSSLFDAIPGVLVDFYSDAFDEALRNNQHVWERSYECSSPERFRQYQMRIHLLERWSWFLVTNQQIPKGSHNKAVAPNPSVYLKDGIVTMCAHCRCSRRIDQPTQWDFVPEYLRLKGLAAFQVSQGLCPLCHLYFYPDLT